MGHSSKVELTCWKSPLVLIGITYYPIVDGFKLHSPLVMSEKKVPFLCTLCLAQGWPLKRKGICWI